MSKKKDIQVFDQSELDNLMAAIQQEDAGPPKEEASAAGDDSVRDESPVSDSSGTEGTRAPSSDGSDDTPEAVAAAEPLDQTPTRQDLDTLIQDLQHDLEGGTGKTDVPEAEDRPAEVFREGTSPAREDGAGVLQGESATSGDIDGSDVRTIDQSELEALIKELQEGVARPIVEDVSEKSGPDSEDEARVRAPSAPPEAGSDAGAASDVASRAESQALSEDVSGGLPGPEEPPADQDVAAEAAVDQAAQQPFLSENDKAESAPPATDRTSDFQSDRPRRQGSKHDRVPDQAPGIEEKSPEVQASLASKSPSASPKKVSRRKYAIGLATVVFFVALAGSVWFVKFRTEPTGPLPPLKVQEETAVQTSPPIERRVAPAPAEKTELSPAERVARIEVKLTEAAALRENLLIKRDEIAGLKKHYQNGISEMQQVVLVEQTKEEIKSYPRGIKNSRIELGLQTIQRRMAYIEQLNKPLAWLDHACEELLFINRLVTIEIRLFDTVSGIDLAQLETQLVEAIQNYQPTVGHLAIGPNDTALPSLKSIWDGIVTANQQRFDQNRSARLPADGRNQQIWQEICDGKYQRKTELTALSTEAAKCLAQSGEPDLFLNGLTNLTPETAKYLFQWEGNWICLNGLTQISSETARYLFGWNGNWLSLNGLKEVRAEAARFLVQWPGRQLELMGLELTGQPFERNTLKYLAQWKQSGGKLYVPDEVEKEIVKLMK